jgi:guanylate kinase
MYEWSSSFDSLGWTRDLLRRRFVVIAGPSGAGKTTLASALCQMDSNYVILCNHTTRAPRPTDPPGHFKHLSDDAFVEAHDNGSFFLARLAPRPRYGYNIEELSHILSTERRPVIMFRHAGTKYLSESLGGLPTVFIEGEPARIAWHSRSTEPPPTEKEVKHTINANRGLQKLMIRRQWPYLCVTNQYAGETELHAITQTIREFLSPTNGR